MKNYALLLSIIIPTVSFAMEQTIEIRNRNLDTRTQPHITIINKLPKNAAFSPRIDVSDKTKINNYTKDSYRPDDSTKAIYSGQGIRFAPRLNKTGEPEHKRLGMNDKGNAALIALYVHGAINHPLIHLVIGKGAHIQFGDAITFATDSDDTILLNHKDKTLARMKTKREPELPQQHVASPKALALLTQFSRPQAQTIQPKNPTIPVHLIGLPDDIFTLQKDHAVSSYINNLEIESLQEMK